MAFKRYVPAGKPNCPRCRTSVRVRKKGWIPLKSRRVIMRTRCMELTTYFYQCGKCQEDKVAKDEVRS